MKKFLLPILLLVASSTFAQNHVIGIKGGVSWTNASKKNPVHNNRIYNYMENRRGFTIGLSYENHLKQHLMVGADVLFQQRGFQDVIYIPVSYNNSELGYFYENTRIKKDLKFYYSYLAFPLKGGYVIGNKISGFANIGLVPSVLLKATAELPDEVEIIDITDLPQKFDLAGLVEIGGNVKISDRLFVTASFSYQHSFTAHSNSDYFERSNLKHHGIILSGGIKYALKKN